ncbi:MAG: T9SS type A sorting domain-containing protein, partial [Saprospiraceae bacterium]|nr:T9SS type A sorting domain-containing protein [Saprospiraceae bacterium]
NTGGYTIVLDVKGGTAPYTFYQDNLVIAEEFQVTEPGVYSIIIFDANNCSVKHTIEINTVKTEDFNDGQFITIYPVPADDVIFVKSSEIGLIGTAYEIISEDGRLLKQGIIQGQSIDVRHLVDGMYFMRFKTDKAHIIKKFVIIK